MAVQVYNDLMILLDIQLVRIKLWIISYNNIFLSHQTNQQHDRFSRNERAHNHDVVCEHILRDRRRI